MFKVAEFTIGCQCYGSVSQIVIRKQYQGPVSVDEWYHERQVARPPPWRENDSRTGGGSGGVAGSQVCHRRHHWHTATSGARESACPGLTLSPCVSPSVEIRKVVRIIDLKFPFTVCSI